MTSFLTLFDIFVGSNFAYLVIQTAVPFVVVSLVLSLIGGVIRG